MAHCGHALSCRSNASNAILGMRPALIHARVWEGLDPFPPIDWVALWQVQADWPLVVTCVMVHAHELELAAWRLEAIPAAAPAAAAAHSLLLQAGRGLAATACAGLQFQHAVGGPYGPLGCNAIERTHPQGMHAYGVACDALMRAAAVACSELRGRGAHPCTRARCILTCGRKRQRSKRRSNHAHPYMHATTPLSGLVVRHTVLGRPFVAPLQHICTHTHQAGIQA